MGVLVASDGYGEQGHDDRQDGSDPEDRGQRHRTLESPTPEGGQPVPDLIGGDEPPGRQLDKVGEGRLAVPTDMGKNPEQANPPKANTRMPAVAVLARGTP